MLVTDLAWIAAGGALGALARYGVTAWTIARFGPGFPMGTLTVNVTGSFLLGLAATLLAVKVRLPAATRPFFTVGFLGAYTTFSAYAFDTITLWGRAAPVGVANVLLNNALSLAAAVLGVTLARLITR
ncbi:MAG: fluoride efflux transporter CrcB [Egibacteraceae bacterium]